MKKVVRTVCIALVIVLVLCWISGCSRLESDADISKPSMFIEVERANLWRVVYHRNTKVMYTVSDYNSSGCGVFTLLVNADGTPMLYEG